jgi:hypothetical protein
VGNIKPVRERSGKTPLSIGLTAGGIVVAAALIVFVVLAVLRAEEVDSSGSDVPAASGSSGERSVTLAPAAADQSNSENPTDGSDAATARSSGVDTGFEVRHLGGVDGVSVALGALVAEEPPRFAAVEPRSQLADAPVRALYPPGAAGNGTTPDQTSVLGAVVELVTTGGGVDGDGADGAGIDDAGSVERLPISPSRQTYVNRSFQELIAEIGEVDRVYRVLDGTDGAHLLLRNGVRQWWSVWIYVSVGEIIDVEYLLSSESDAPE